MTVTENQIFNLMNTNGRRKDVIDALQGYLTILDDISRKQKLPWGRLPGSAAEFEFYRQAIALSPDVFQIHGKYDALVAQPDEMPALKKAIAERDVYWLSQNYGKYPILKLRIFDRGEKKYYSPFCMALYALLRKERISQDVFCAIVQGL